MATRIVDLGSVVGPPGASGAKGEDGKSAYQYAVDGGYTGTEAEFKAKTAKEYLPLTGGDMAGNIDMSNHFLTGLPAPVAPSDAVNYHTLVSFALSISTVKFSVAIRGHTRTNTDTVEFSYVEGAVVGNAGTYVVFRVNETALQIPSNTDLYDITGVELYFPEILKYGPDWSVGTILTCKLRGISKNMFPYGDTRDTDYYKCAFDRISPDTVTIAGSFKAVISV